jgi:hypothetical protein
LGQPLLAKVILNIMFLREIYASELDICTPAEALVVMIAQLNVKYFEEFGHQLIKMFQSLTGKYCCGPCQSIYNIYFLTASSGYFQTIMIGAIILFLVYILLTTSVQSMFKYGFGFAAHTISNSNAAPSNQINNAQQEKLTENVGKLQQQCDSLAKKIKQRKDSQRQIIIIEKSYDPSGGIRVEEIRKLAIDVGAKGDGVVNESSDDFSDCSVLIDNEDIGESKLLESEKKVEEMPSSWKGPYLPK